MFLESYVYEHNRLIASINAHYLDDLSTFYEELAEALFLRFKFIQAADADGDAFLAHLVVCSIIASI